MGLVREHRLHAVVNRYRHRIFAAEIVAYRHVDVVAEDPVGCELVAQLIAQFLLVIGVFVRMRRVENHVFRLDRYSLPAPYGLVAFEGLPVHRYAETLVVGRPGRTLHVFVVRSAPAAALDIERADIVAVSQVEHLGGFAFRAGRGRPVRIGKGSHAVEGIDFVEQAALEPVEDIRRSVHFGRNVEVVALALDVHHLGIGAFAVVGIAAVAAVLFAGTFVGAGGRRQEQTADQQAA